MLEHEHQIYGKKKNSFISKKCKVQFHQEEKSDNSHIRYIEKIYREHFFIIKTEEGTENTQNNNLKDE